MKDRRLRDYDYYRWRLIDALPVAQDASGQAVSVISPINLLNATAKILTEMWAETETEINEKFLKELEKD